MPTTLRTELTKAGFTVGGGGTTLVVQDYVVGGTVHAKPSAKRTLDLSTAADNAILDQRFANGAEWNGHRYLVAYDANNMYVQVQLPYSGAGFKAFPLTPAGIGTTIPHAEDHFRHTRRPSQGGIGTPTGSG